MNKIKLDVRTLLIVALSIVLVFSLRKCMSIEEDNSRLVLEKYSLDSIKNTLAQTVLLKEAEITASQEALRVATDSIFSLKRKDERKIKDIIAFYQSRTNTVVKDSLVPYVDTLAVKKWEDSVRLSCSQVIDYYEHNYIPVPRTAADSTPNFSAHFTATFTGIRIDSLYIPNTQSVRFVTLKGGFLKKDQQGKRHLFLKKSVQVQIINSNPLISTGGVTAALYSPPKKQRWGERSALILAGVILGIILQ